MAPLAPPPPGSATDVIFPSAKSLVLPLQTVYHNNFNEICTFVEKPCINEIASMLECLQMHEFDQADCEKEISKFNECMQNHQVSTF